MPLRVAVLGGGSFGTTVASLACRNAPALLWARRRDLVDEINREHSNARYLPGFRLPESLRSTDSLEEAVSGADVVVMGVPSHGFRAVLEELAPYLRPWVPVVSLAKGLEQGSHLRMTQVIQEVLPEHRAGVLTGPNLAKEIMAGFAAASVIAIEDAMVASQLQATFHSGLFRVYSNDDVVGCELGGALKNVIAIASGMGDGLGVGDNTRAMVITRGLAEITRLGVALGGRPETFMGLAGAGDLILTCTDNTSRNRRLGLGIGQGRTPRAVLAELGQEAEGYATAREIHELGQRARVEMPICEQVYRVLYEQLAPQAAVEALLRREPKAE